VKAHETDVTSLVFGLMFLGTALVWAMVELGVITVSMLPVAVPTVLVVVGVIGVVASVARGRAREDRVEP
jgi:hypothetical protein